MLVLKIIEENERKLKVTNLISPHRDGNSTGNGWVGFIYCIGKGEQHQWKPDNENDQQQEQTSNSIFNGGFPLLCTRGWISLRKKRNK